MFEPATDFHTQLELIVFSFLTLLHVVYILCACLCGLLVLYVYHCGLHIALSVCLCPLHALARVISKLDGAKVKDA